MNEDQASKTGIYDPVDKSFVSSTWLEKSKIPFEELKKGIESGRLLLLPDGSILRRGYTTGTVAAVAAKAAVLSLRKELKKGEIVTIETPVGVRAGLPVSASRGQAIVIKDAGDHERDITNGIKIVAEATEYEKISVEAGEGIGIVTRKGLAVDVGKPAINPVAFKHILKAVQEAVFETGLKGALVTISVPNGEEISKKTRNEKVGVIGGISILGSTGFVEPWNDNLEELFIDMVKKAGKVVLTTGRLGAYHSKVLFQGYDVVLVGSRISESVKHTVEKDVILCGLPGLILKWGNPKILEETGFLTVSELVKTNPSYEVIDATLQKIKTKYPKLRIVLLNKDGSILRDTG